MDTRETLTVEEFFGLPREKGFRFSHFEDYGESVEHAEHYKKIKAWKWVGSKNTVLIQEDSLQRTLKFIENSSFAILAAYRKESSKEENIKRNRKLRAIFNAKKMGVHQLVGHWSEEQKDESFLPSAERSYLVVKPAGMSDKEFKDLIFKCLTIDGETRDGAVAKFISKGDDIYFLKKTGALTKAVGKVNFSNAAVKLADAYSQHVKKSNTPFVFDGEEVPQTIIGNVIYKNEGFLHS